MTEHWRPVPSWEGLYSVSTHARVRSEPRYVPRRGGAGYTVRGRVLKPNRAGCVNLSRQGARRSANCRTLRGEAFDNEATA